MFLTYVLLLGGSLVLMWVCVRTGYNWRSSENLDGFVLRSQIAPDQEKSAARYFGTLLIAVGAIVWLNLLHFVVPKSAWPLL